MNILRAEKDSLTKQKDAFEQIVKEKKDITVEEFNRIKAQNDQNDKKLRKKNVSDINQLTSPSELRKLKADHQKDLTKKERDIRDANSEISNLKQKIAGYKNTLKTKIGELNSDDQARLILENRQLKKDNEGHLTEIGQLSTELQELRLNSLTHPSEIAQKEAELSE